jgi:hypothetical protein
LIRKNAGAEAEKPGLVGEKPHIRLLGWFRLGKLGSIDRGFGSHIVSYAEIL